MISRTLEKLQRVASEVGKCASQMYLHVWQAALYGPGGLLPWYCI